MDLLKKIFSVSRIRFVVAKVVRVVSDRISFTRFAFSRVTLDFLPLFYCVLNNIVGVKHSFSDLFHHFFRSCVGNAHVLPNFLDSVVFVSVELQNDQTNDLGSYILSWFWRLFRPSVRGSV